MSKPLPVIRRVQIQPGKIGAVFQEMMDFIVGRTVKRMEIIAESTEASAPWGDRGRFAPAGLVVVLEGNGARAVQ